VHRIAPARRPRQNAPDSWPAAMLLASLSWRPDERTRVEEVIIVFKSHFDIAIPTGDQRHRAISTLDDRSGLGAWIDQNRDLPAEAALVWTSRGGMKKMLRRIGRQTPERQHAAWWPSRTAFCVVARSAFTTHTELLETGGPPFADDLRIPAVAHGPGGLRACEMTDVPCHTWALAKLSRRRS